MASLSKHIDALHRKSKIRGITMNETTSEIELRQQEIDLKRQEADARYEEVANDRLRIQNENSFSRKWGTTIAGGLVTILAAAIALIANAHVAKMEVNQREREVWKEAVGMYLEGASNRKADAQSVQDLYLISTLAPDDETKNSFEALIGARVQFVLETNPRLNWPVRRQRLWPRFEVVA